MPERWSTRHPALVDEIDRLLNGDAAWGAICMVVACVLPSFTIGVAALIAAAFFGAPWWSIAGVGLFSAAFFSFSACVVWREDHQ
jgi:hypothetical protein